MRGRKQRHTQEFVIAMCCLFGALCLFIGIASGMIPV